MRHIYENRSGKVHRLFLITEDRNGGNQMVFVPGSRIDLGYPGLDNYVPHLLAKINEHGYDISMTVEAQRRSLLSDTKSEDVVTSEDTKPSEPVSPVVELVPEVKAAEVVVEAEEPEADKKKLAKEPKKSFFKKEK